MNNLHKNTIINTYDFPDTIGKINRWKEKNL